jgi:phosphatidylserine/phosphatidylglycerophosphate/cardiolipin synthase-like enzyme
MSEPAATISTLPTEQLAALREAIQNRWISLSTSPSLLANYVGGHAGKVAEELRHLAEQGFDETQVAILLRTAHSSRCVQSRDDISADLVLSGPDVPGVPTAATDAVVTSLFLRAKHEIIIAGYAFHQARAILEPLANRMQESSSLKVVLHVDISRGFTDTSTSESIVLRFAQEFWKKHWPWKPRPGVWYDPRALEMNREERACLHAKFIAIDRDTVLITSANFTEAAQKRNIEAGLLFRSPARARQLTGYFEALRANRQLLPLP